MSDARGLILQRVRFAHHVAGRKRRLGDEDTQGALGGGAEARRESLRSRGGGGAASRGASTSGSVRATVPRLLRFIAESGCPPTADERLLLAFYPPPKLGGVGKKASPADLVARRTVAEQKVVETVDEIMLRRAGSAEPGAGAEHPSTLVLDELRAHCSGRAVPLPEALRLVAESRSAFSAKELVAIAFATPPQPKEWLPAKLRPFGEALVDIGTPGKGAEMFANSSTSTYDALLAVTEVGPTPVHLCTSDLGDTLGEATEHQLPVDPAAMVRVWRLCC